MLTEMLQRVKHLSRGVQWDGIFNLKLSVFFYCFFSWFFSTKDVESVLKVSLLKGYYVCMSI